MQRAVRDGGAEPEPLGGPGGGERAVRPGETGEEIAEGILHRLGERLGHTDRERCAQGVAEPPRVLDRRPVVGPGDPDLDGPPGGRQLRRPGGLGAPLGQLGIGEGAQDAQQIRDPFDVLDPAVLGEPLELPLQLGEDLGVEQFAQLRLAQQLGQEVGVQGERGGPPLGERRVALVQELGDVTEEEGAGERGGLLGGDLYQPDPARLQVTHQFGEPGNVEDVLEALADGFEDDRERTELGCHLEQL